MVASPPKFDDRPALGKLLRKVLACWPEHEKFIHQSFDHRTPAVLETSNEVSRMILDLEGDDIDGLCADYKWTCEQLQIEEINFRRSGKYRHTSFCEAEREVYGNAEFMRRYVRGLLLSHVLWANHTAVIDCYLREFLPTVPDDGCLLEIGPGHGLLLCLAARQHNGPLLGWDVSETSINVTRAALAKLRVQQPVDLRISDIFQPAASNQKFDAILLCEILEHLENPDAALANVRDMLAPRGRVFINVPINSPAPDHIYLLRSPSESIALVERNGFRVIRAHHFPMGGKTLERSERLALTISSTIIAESAA